MYRVFSGYEGYWVAHTQLERAGAILPFPWYGMSGWADESMRSFFAQYQDNGRQSGWLSVRTSTAACLHLTAG